MHNLSAQENTVLDAFEDNRAERISWSMRAKLALAAIIIKLWALLPRGWISGVYRFLFGMTGFLPAQLRRRARNFITYLRAQRAGIEQDYSNWIELFERTDQQARRVAMAHVARLNDPPRISIIMPVFNSTPQHLRAAIRSVQDQFYPNWELCIADDASTNPVIAPLLRNFAKSDPRIHVIRREQNGHISAASNSALDLATGTFVALMDHDDLLAPNALYEVAVRIIDCPTVDIIYSDEDHVDENGRRAHPYFKPDWNPDLMLGQNLINHLGVYRRSLIERLGGFRIGMEGSQDYDLALRTIGETTPDRIVHIPHVLYHWRQHSKARSFSNVAGETCALNGRRAVQEFLTPKIPGATVQPAPAVPSWNRVVYPVPQPEPLVSVIIPTRNRADLLARTVEGLLSRTNYSALNVLIVDNGSDEPATLALLTHLSHDSRIRVIQCPGPFNYSALNNRAVQESTGELVLLLNNDIDVINPDWLREMVSHAVRPGIGAVGAKLIYPNDTIQHGGVTVGVGGVAGHQYLHKPREDVGYFGQLALVRNVTAVTGACLLLRRQAYLEVGGLDEVSLSVAFNDVDLCLKLVKHGYRNLWTPFAELYHFESASRGSDLVGEKAARFKREVTVMRQRWSDVLDQDPYWNPNLALSVTGISLAFPPRSVVSAPC